MISKNKEGKMETTEVLKSIGKMLVAPFIGLFYATLLPFAFFYAIGSAVLKSILGIVGVDISFGWRPVEAYFAGKKSKKKRDVDKKDEK